MTETQFPEEGPVKKAGPRTITITLPSWWGLGVAFVSGVLLAALVLGGVWGYRHFDHRQRLESARNEIAELFKTRQTKASSLLEVAGREAAQFQQDLALAQKATKSSSIPLPDFAGRQQRLTQDLSAVQAVLAELAEQEQGLIQRYKLSPEDTLFSLEDQEQFNRLQQQWDGLSRQQEQLGGDLETVVARKNNLLASEQKATATAAARKAAQAQAQAQARARAAQQRQAAPMAVFGAPAYRSYGTVSYYGAPFYGGYYQRPYYWGGGGYGYGGNYGYGWGPSTSVGIGFTFR